ncbi:MAG: preprotein translocase subunit SecE [Kofleriaceae bacterium]
MAYQENAPNKPVHLMYLCGAIIVFYVSQWTIDWIVGYFTTPPGEVATTLISFVFATTLAIVMYRNERIHGLASEVSAELKKVTWPTAKEVRSSTIVVIIMAVLAALILGLFDAVWSKFTDLIYG